MKKNYLRKDLINDLLRKYGGVSYQILPDKPTGKYIACVVCKHKTVRIEMERYGDGTVDYVNWVAEVYAGVCQREECGCLNLWIELIDQDEIDQQNRRLLTELCDKILKQL